MDHTITVEPGSEFPLQAAGDFVFCKFADRDIRVIIQNSPRTMRAGSKWRPAGGFEAGDVIVQNPDPVNPVAVVLTIGVGDFDDQIIRGEVTVNPGIRGADGQFRDDTRREIAVDLYPLRDYGLGYVAGEVVRSRPVEPAGVHYVVFQYRGLPCVYAPRSQDGPGWAHEFWMLGHDLTPSGRFTVPGVDAGFRSTTDVTEFRGALILTGDAQDSGRLFRADAATRTVEQVALIDGGIVSVWGAPEGLYVAAMDPDRLYLLDDGFSVIGSWDFGIVDWLPETCYTTFKGRYDWTEGVHWITARNPQWLRVGATPESAVDVLTDQEYQDAGIYRAWDRYEGFCPIGRRVVGVDSDDNAVLVQIRPVYEPVKLLAAPPGCDGAAWRHPGNVITAQVVAHPDGDGVIVTGEVIRATLEQYLGREVDEGYLDHVFAFSTARAVGPGLGVNLYSGGSSFARAGIADQLTVRLPARIKMTWDGQL